MVRTEKGTLPGRPGRLNKTGRCRRGTKNNVANEALACHTPDKPVQSLIAGWTKRWIRKHLGKTDKATSKKPDTTWNCGRRERRLTVTGTNPGRGRDRTCRTPENHREEAQLSEDTTKDYKKQRNEKPSLYASASVAGSVKGSFSLCAQR